jgi:hypothetical protein
MPNHVESSLDIKGNAEDLKDLLNFIKGINDHDEYSEFTCHKIIPMPENIRQDMINEKTEDWYQWRIKNWGTKWDVYSLSFYIPQFCNSLEFIKSKKQHNIRICFQTAWSPITPIITVLAEKYPALKFDYAYIDEGGRFACIEKYKSGLMTEIIEDFKKTKRKLCYIPKNLVSSL